MIIDWELSYYGSIAFDFLNALFDCLNVEVWKIKIDEASKLYYDEFTSVIKTTIKDKNNKQKS
eukprot:UN16184